MAITKKRNLNTLARFDELHGAMTDQAASCSRSSRKKKARVALATLASLSPRDEAGEGFVVRRPAERISRRSREHRPTIGA
jgi:hypothetical protein